MRQYSISENINEEKWTYLLSSRMREADAVEFNILYQPNKLQIELAELEPYLILKGKRKDKIYISGEFRRYRLSSEVKEFIFSKSYKSWYNYQFEDLSLLKNETEVLATITHENYVILLMTEEERQELNAQGFDFGDYSKFTLSLNEKVIEQAKVYARDHQISLSKLIESYLSSLIKNESEDIEITPLVESLSGVVEVPVDFDYRSDYTDYLLDKYQ